MIRIPVLACFFFVSLSLTSGLTAQVARVTSAGVAYSENSYQEAITELQKAFEKPELLNAKQMAKAHALYAKSLLKLYEQVEKATPEKKATFQRTYPNAFEDIKKSMDFVKNSPEGAPYEKELIVFRERLAQIYVQKLQESLGQDTKDYNAQIQYANNAEEVIKGVNVNHLFPIIISFLKGMVYYQQSIDQGNPEAIDRAALAEFKKCISLYKSTQLKPEEKKSIDLSVAGAYANAIGISGRVDKANVKALIEEAKAKFPDNKPIEEMSLQAQVSSGNTDEGEKALYDAIQKDPKNEQKLLVYASLLEKKFEALAKAKPNDPETETAYQKVVAAYQAVLNVNPAREEANYNLGAIIFNRAVEVNKQLQELPDDAPDSKIKALDNKKKDYMRQALPYFEKAAEKNGYKDDSALSTLITITMELGMNDKTNFYNQKKKELKK
jgi:hypothetical protein